MYHISTNTSLKKKGKLTLKHFGDLQTKKHAINMTFFTAKSSPVEVDDKKVYQFSVVKGGEFQMGEDYGTISLESLFFVAEGMKEEEIEDELATEDAEQICQISESEDENNAAMLFNL